VLITDLFSAEQLLAETEPAVITNGTDRAASKRGSRTR
jgi:hypothetical protein